MNNQVNGINQFSSKLCDIFILIDTVLEIITFLLKKTKKKQLLSIIRI